MQRKITPRLAAAYGHVTLSSVDPDIQGFHGLEMVFHEASHADPLEAQGGYAEAMRKVAEAWVQSGR